jgi:hypothetical protein
MYFALDWATSSSDRLKHYTMKAYGGVDVIDPHFLDHGTRLEVNGQLHALATSSPLSIE